MSEDNEVLDLAMLREVAEAATPGPWRMLFVNGVKRCDIRAIGGFDYRGAAVATAADSEFGACPTLDAAHIATFDPPTVLALIDRLERAEAAVERFESLAERLVYADVETWVVDAVHDALDADR